MNPQLRIIGPPRSGTNYAKYLVDNNTDVEAGFNIGWWKHAVIPPIMQRTDPVLNTIPTIIMIRRITEQIQSFWRFCQKGRSAISSDAKSFSDFLRQPIYMTPFEGMKYFFDSPLSYISQFYQSAAGNIGPKVFVNLADLKNRPKIILECLRGLDFNYTFQTEEKLKIPTKYLGRNADIHLSGDEVYEDDGFPSKIMENEYERVGFFDRRVINSSHAAKLVNSIIAEIK